MSGADKTKAGKRTPPMPEKEKRTLRTDGRYTDTSSGVTLQRLWRLLLVSFVLQSVGFSILGYALFLVAAGECR